MSFGKNKSEEANSPIELPVGNSKGKLEAFLGKGSKVKGSLNFTGKVQLDGFVEGEIESHGELAIGETADIRAKVEGEVIIVRGTVVGDILASKQLSLVKPA